MLNTSGTPKQPVASITGVTVITETSSEETCEFNVVNDGIFPVPETLKPVFAFVFVQL